MEPDPPHFPNLRVVKLCRVLGLKQLQDAAPAPARPANSRPFIPAMPLLNLVLLLFHPGGLMLLNGHQVVVAVAETAGVEGSPHVPNSPAEMAAAAVLKK
jgi:hypothetical protein